MAHGLHRTSNDIPTNGVTEQRHSNIAAPRKLFGSALLGGLLYLATCGGANCAVRAQEAGTGLPHGTPLDWAVSASQNQVALLQEQGSYSVQYRERKIDAKGDTTREVIESKDGGVARLVERNGKPISAAEDTAERDRLQNDLQHPEDFARHHRHDANNRADAVQLIQLLPQAMILTYTRDQPQLPGAAGRQVVLDYRPNPSFHPPTMLADLLTGIEGRVWIDEATRHVVKIEGRVLKPVNFGFGMVAHIFPGGTLEMEQTPAEGGRWVYSHLEEHLSVRVAMVKTIPDNVRIHSTDFIFLPGPVSWQDGIRRLLAMPLPAS